MNSTTNPVIASVADASGEMLALEPQSPRTSGMTIASIRQLIADDAHACTFQSFSQYRTALLKAIDQASPPSPSSSSSSEAERDAFEATVGDGRVLTRTPSGDYVSPYVQNDWDVWQAAGKEIQRAACNFCLAQAAEARAALAAATPPSLPIDFTQASEQGGWLPIATAPKSEALRLLILDVIDWGRSYGQRLSLSDVTLQDVAQGYAEKAVALLTTPSPHPEEGALLLGGDEGGKAMGGAA